MEGTVLGNPGEEKSVGADLVAPFNDPNEVIKKRESGKQGMRCKVTIKWNEGGPIQFKEMYLQLEDIQAVGEFA